MPVTNVKKVNTNLVNIMKNVSWSSVLLAYLWCNNLHGISFIPCFHYFEFWDSILGHLWLNSFIYFLVNLQCKNKHIFNVFYANSAQIQYTSSSYETNLGKIAIPGEAKTGKIHNRESTVHVHIHIRSGIGSAAVRVVLPEGKRNS